MGFNFRTMIVLGRLFFSVVFVAALLTSPVSAQLSQWWRTCTGKPDVDWDEQIKSCTAIIASAREAQEKRAIAYKNRGIAWSEKREYSRAIPDFTEAIRLSPNFADAYFNRGRAWYYGPSDVGRAIADYTAAIRIDPDHADAYFYRAFAWRFRGDTDRAIADLTEVIRIDPKYLDAYYFRGGDWYDKGDFERAIADYSEAIRLDPEYADAYSARGNAWIAKGEFDRAIADYTEAIRVEPDNGGHHGDRGYARFYSGDYHAAAADLHRAIELKLTGFKAIEVALFRYVARTRAGQDATPELEMYYADFVSPHPVFALFLGRGSAQAVLEAKSGARDRCGAEFYVGEWHFIRGNHDEARTHLQLAADPRCSVAMPYYPAAVAELKRIKP